VIQELVDLKRAYSPAKVDILVANIRRICHNLKPQILEDLGFSAALESLAQEIRSQTGAMVTLSYDDDELSKLPKTIELPLFRVIQEVANNIKKHANASKVRISLVYDPSAHRDLRIQVVDDGVGFDWAIAKKGMGLLGIRERVDRLGGHFILETAPSEGCSFQFYIPLKSI
jgi:two-component system NarL family sensor kinase